MNKKGFTLVELIAVIAILGILAGMVVIAYTAFIDKTRDKVYENYMDNMHEAAIMYALSHTISNKGEKTLYISDLGINSINNPDNENDKCLNSFVEVKRNDQEETKTANKKVIVSFTYKVCLQCDEFKECKEYIN